MSEQNRLDEVTTFGELVQTIFDAIDEVAARVARIEGQLGLPQIGEPCAMCGPGYRIGDDGCRHGAAAGGAS